MAGATRRSGTVRATARPPQRDEAPVLVDCATCAVRGIGCSDCVVALLLGPPDEVALDGGQVQALAVLAGSGLVPPLRHTRVGRGA